MKQIKINPLPYEILIELSKKQRIKPEEFIELLIRQAYERKK
jgi:hypothetical protein